jgi:hypothetical protein
MPNHEEKQNNYKNHISGYMLEPNREILQFFKKTSKTWQQDNKKHVCIHFEKNKNHQLNKFSN